MFLKKVIAGITALTLSATMTAGVINTSKQSTMVADASSEVVITPSKTYQNIRGFGGMNCPEWAGDLTSSQRVTAFGNGDNQLGLSVLRVFVNPDSNQWSKAVDTAKYAAQQGATVFASPWQPPSNLLESGGSNGKYHLPAKNYAAYATHLNNFGTYMKNNGVNLYAISVQNEPDYASEWTYWSTDETTSFIANYGDRITSTRLMSPESFQYAPLTASWVKDGGKKFYQKILQNSKAMANCDVFGTHMYGTQTSWMDYPELENSGKEIWMTEVYTPNSNANSANNWPEAIGVAENIHDAMVVGNMSVYTWWYIRRSYGLMTEDGKISKRGYMMAQYSKYVRPGAKRIDATANPTTDVRVSAYKNTDGTIAVVAVNSGTTDDTQKFSLSGVNIKNVNRFRTSANENLAKTTNLSFTGNGFWATLPAKSVSTFVITPSGTVVSSNTSSSSSSSSSSVSSSTSSSTNTSNAMINDTFESSICDWSARGSVKLSMSGRQPYAGTNALVISNRTAAWNGAQKSLSTSTYKPGSKYSFETYTTFLDSSSSSQTINMTLQYKNTSGTTKYVNIASANVTKGTYAKLSNSSFTIPSDVASDMYLVVETSSGSDNFYIDNVVVKSASSTSSSTSSSTNTNTSSSSSNTTSSSSSSSVTLSNISYNTAVNLSSYNYKNIKSITVTFNSGSNSSGSGCLVLGGWAESHSITASALSNNSIKFSISNPQSTMTLYNYYGMASVKSVTLNY